MTKLKNLYKRAAKVGLAGLAALSIAGASACAQTDTTEIGVRYNKLTGQPTVVEPSQVVLDLPLIHDWYTLDTKMQPFYMTASKDDGDRPRRDDLVFKTKDGNNIGQDVVFTWKVDYSKTPYILEHVGQSIEDIQEKVVRPVVRTVVRDHLNELTSAQFYNGEGRFIAAKAATEDLSNRLAQYGIIVDQVNPKEFRFGSKEFQKAIDDAENAREEVQIYQRKQTAQTEHWKSELQRQIGESNRTIEEAKQYKETKHNAADGKYAEDSASAKATLTELVHKAESTAKLRNAMASRGGMVAVQRKYAEHFKPDKITVLPCATGNDVTLNKLDMTALIAAEAVKEK